jgi:hypothetical protein
MKYILFLLFLGLLALIIWFFWGSPKKSEKITWGVNFSLKQAIFLELDSKELYLSLLDDLNFKNVKISLHWDLMQPKEDEYDFTELDWQVAVAEKRNVNLTLAIGMKTPRWPECHLPQWAINLTKEQQQQKILEYLEVVVLRYKNSSALYMWQVENEPFFKFGACPWSDENFLKKEIALVKQLDPNHPILITDSGEMSTWNRAAQLGDAIGFTTYRTVWQDQLKFYFCYDPWISPMYYYRRAQFIEKIYHKKAIGVELQAEPWCKDSVMRTPIEEQEKTMSLAQLKKAIQFAKDTKIDTYYFWGAEWWSWMKTKQNHPEYWNEIKQLISE